MVSTLLILVVAFAVLFFSWSLLRLGAWRLPKPQLWEQNGHEVDVQIFRVLTNCNEARFLRSSLSPAQFRQVQRRRIRLTLRILRLVEGNAEWLMSQTRLAKSDGDRTGAKVADELIAAAVQLRLNLWLARVYLCVQWLSPTWTFSVPDCAAQYQRLLDSLAGIRGRSWQPST